MRTFPVNCLSFYMPYALPVNHEPYHQGADGKSTYAVHDYLYRVSSKLHQNEEICFAVFTAVFMCLLVSVIFN